MKRIIFLLAFLANAACAEVVNLSWDIPTHRENNELLPISEIDGYEIVYKRTQDSTYSVVQLQNRNATNHQLNLQPGPYEFRIAVFDTDGLYSDYSDPVYYSVTSSGSSSGSSSSSSSSGGLVIPIPSNGSLSIAFGKSNAGENVPLEIISYGYVQRNSNGNFNVVFPADAQMVLFLPAGYTGATGAKFFATGNFSNNGTLQLTERFSQRYDGSFQANVIALYYMLNNDPNWPGSGTKTFYHTTGNSYEEGYQIGYVFLKGVDLSSPIIGHSSADEPNTPAALTGVGVGDLTFITAYMYNSTVDVDVNGQTSIIETTVFNSCGLSVGYKFGETVMTHGAGGEIVHGQFAIRAATGGSVELSVNSMTIAPAMQNVTLQQHNTLAVQDFVSSPSFENIALSSAGELSVQDMVVDAVFESPTLNQKHTLQVQDIDLSPVFESPTLLQHNVLSVNDISLPGSFEAIELVQNSSLQVNGMSVSVSFENPLLVQANILAVNDLRSLTQFQGVELIQSHVLAAQSIQVEPSFESPLLQFGLFLSVSDMLSAPSFEDVHLLQAHILVTQDMALQPVFENPAVQFSVVLSTQDMVSQSSFENPLLSPAEFLQVQKMLVQASMENPELLQSHILVVPDIVLNVDFEHPIFPGGLFSASRIVLVSDVERLVNVQNTVRVVVH